MGAGALLPRCPWALGQNLLQTAMHTQSIRVLKVVGDSSASRQQCGGQTSWMAMQKRRDAHILQILRQLGAQRLSPEPGGGWCTCKCQHLACSASAWAQAREEEMHEDAVAMDSSLCSNGSLLSGFLTEQKRFSSVKHGHQGRARRAKRKKRLVSPGRGVKGRGGCNDSGSRS